MDITRKAVRILFAGVTVMLGLQGCGGGGYSSGGSSGMAGGSTCGASGSDISANHGHVLTIRSADLDSPTDMSFDLTPSADGHIHGVTFTTAQLASLKAGASVTVTSTVAMASGIYGGTHSHEVTAQVDVATCP